MKRNGNNDLLALVGKKKMEGKNSSLNLHGDRQLKSTKVLFSVIDTKSTEKSINSRVLNGTVQV